MPRRDEIEGDRTQPSTLLAETVWRDEELSWCIGCTPETENPGPVDHPRGGRRVHPYSTTYPGRRAAGGPCTLHGRTSRVRAVSEVRAVTPLPKRFTSLPYRVMALSCLI